MCDNKNGLHKNEKDKSKRNTSTRLDLDITDTTDTYPEFDFLDLLRNLQVEHRKAKNKNYNEESANKSHLFSEDSEVEELARFYEEKYGTTHDYAYLGGGYDEDDSFIDNSGAVNDLIPDGIQTEFGGFYINRGKLTFIKEENSSNSVSEDVDKFLSQNRLNIKRASLDEENYEKHKECGKNPGNNNLSSKLISNNNSNINSLDNNIDNSTTNNANSNIKIFNNNNSNNICNLGNGTIKNRKKSGEFHHKSKKNRKTATPKIPDHLIHRKPFSGSSEFQKNINEIKKNRMKVLEAEKKTVSSDLISSDTAASINITTSAATITSATTTTSAASATTTTSASTTTVTSININKNSNNCNNNIFNSSYKKNENDRNNINTSRGSNRNNDHYNHINHFNSSKKEVCVKKKAATVKDILKERDAASEVIEAVATGADLCHKTNNRESSSASESSETSSSDSGSESTDEESVEKRKVASVEETANNSQRTPSINGVVNEDFTAKRFAHLNDNLKSLIAKIIEISKEEKSKLSNSKLNSLLLRVDGRLRELPVSERSAVLEHLANILQLKKESITKRTKKLLFMQEEAKMSVPFRKLKEIVSDMMPALESNYFKEFTKAAGTRSVEPGSLPQKIFPWNDELRIYLRDIIKHRENCYYIIRPRKESITDYIRNFLETKLISFWPKDWMTVDLLWEEGKVFQPITGTVEEKHKTINKLTSIPNSSSIVSHKKPIAGSSNLVTCNKKQVISNVTLNEIAKTNSTISKSSDVKSILIPRKLPQNPGSTIKSNYPVSTASSFQANNVMNRLQVSGSKGCVQDYLEKLSSHSHTSNRNPSQQAVANKSQKQTSPNSLIKTVSPNTIHNSCRSNASRTTSPNTVNKSVSYRSCSNSQQSVLKTFDIQSRPISIPKSSGNSVTISPVTESMLKDITSSPEILNLTKNPSVCISKITECPENKFNRSNSPSINIPLPSGITISTTNSMSSNFLAKQQKPQERTSDNRINVSLMKQELITNSFKDKRETVLNMNIKRENPLQNIPDCISVTSNVVHQERYKVEHVRKRALQEYHQQQQRSSPERLKVEEKKVKLEDNLLSDIEIKEEKVDDKNFSKMFDSVIAKTSESVRQNEDVDCQITSDKYIAVDGDLVVNSNNLPVYCPSGLNHYKTSASKLRDNRVGKEKPFFFTKSESSMYTNDNKRQDDSDEFNENVKEMQVQKEMDRVMQNLVELSNQRAKEADYEMESHYTSTTPTKSKTSFQEVLQKMLFK